MSTSPSSRIASTLADLDMPTAHLVIELALDGRYQLPGDELNQNRVLSNPEHALAEQEREFMRFRSVYGLSQSTSVAASGSLSNVGTTSNIIGILGSRTDRGGNDSESPSHSELLDDLPSIQSETDSIPDDKDEDEDDPRPHDAYFPSSAIEPYYDDLPSIRSETPELPDDIANESRRSSTYYPEKAKSLESLPSIRSETFSRDEDNDDYPLSDDAHTLAAVGNGHYDDLPSICSETHSMSSWTTLVYSGQSVIGNGVIQADTAISPEPLVEDVHDANVPTGTGIIHTLHRCSKVLLDVIDGIGCIRWRRIKDGILGTIFAPQAQDSPEPSL